MKLFQKLIVLALALVCGAGAYAQAPYPTRPVRIVVTFGGGGAAEIYSRLIGQHLTAMWGQTVLADPRPGANEIIAIEIVARASFNSSAYRPIDPRTTQGEQHGAKRLRAVSVFSDNAPAEMESRSCGVRAISVTAAKRAAFREVKREPRGPVIRTRRQRLKSAQLDALAQDGRRATHAYDSPRRDREAPYEERELREKFRELAGLVLTPADVADMESIVARCDEWSSVTELTDACRGYERATR